jgi:hypothetical protein
MIKMNDKIVKLVGFRNNSNFEIENRTLWSEILIRKIHCEKCKSQDCITFHTKDIPKLIRGLNKLLKLQNIKHKKWKRIKLAELESEGKDE